MEENQNLEETINDEEEFQLSHMDKLVGVFSEPSATFEKISRLTIKNSDWLIPLLLFIIVAILSNAIIMTNPTIKYKIIEKQTAAMEKRFDKMVEDGRMTREQADKAMDNAREMMQSNSGTALALRAVGTLISVAIIFFIIAFVFHVFVKIFFKGEGGYSSTLVAYGLSYYILIIQVILIVIVSMIFNRMFGDLSVGSFLQISKSSFGGFLLSKLDPFLIWFYGVLGLGLAKVHKSPDTTKYVILVYAMWLGFSVILYFLATSMPFLQGFIR